MANRRLSIHSFLQLTALAVLAACSGMTPGGAPSDVGGGGPVTIGNSLDGGGSDVAGGGGIGGGDLPVGGAGGGQAGPSTQQSNDNIGGGCVLSFHVKVKVRHNGSEEACTAATTKLFRTYGDDIIANNGGGVYAPVDEEPDGPPKVTVDPAGAMPTTQTLSCVEGRWQTTEPFFFRAVCEAGTETTASATWRRNGQTHLSNTFSGAPERNADYSPIPLELTIDLGQDDEDD